MVTTMPRKTQTCLSFRAALVLSRFQVKLVLYTNGINFWVVPTVPLLRDSRNAMKLMKWPHLHIYIYIYMQIKVLITKKIRINKFMNK